MKGLDYHKKDYFNTEDTYVVEVFEGAYRLTKLKKKNSRFFALTGSPVYVDTTLSIKLSDLIGQEVELNGVRGKITKSLHMENKVLSYLGVYWYGTFGKNQINEFWTEMNPTLKFVSE